MFRFRLFVFTSTCLLFMTVPQSLADPVDADDERRVKAAESPAGMPAVRLDEKQRALAGLETAPVRETAYQPEFVAYGKAVNVQPLVALRSQYRVAQSEQKGAGARLVQSGQSIRRTEELYKHGVAARRVLQEQQSLWQTDQAQLEARRAQSDAVLEEANVQWGPELARWALTGGQDRLGDLVSGKATLLIVTLPVGKELPGPGANVVADPEGNRAKAVAAEYISPAPQADQIVQGASYFFKTADRRVRPGMSVSVWLPDGEAGESGVSVPESALIRSMDQAFVFVKTGPDTFSRRVLSDYIPWAEGYFVRGALRPGEEIVTSGGQMLFSEELRAQIPSEDD